MAPTNLKTQTHYKTSGMTEVEQAEEIGKDALLDVATVGVGCTKTVKEAAYFRGRGSLGFNPTMVAKAKFRAALSLTLEEGNVLERKFREKYPRYNPLHASFGTGRCKKAGDAQTETIEHLAANTLGIEGNLANAMKGAMEANYKVVTELLKLANGTMFTPGGQRPRRRRVRHEDMKKIVRGQLFSAEVQAGCKKRRKALNGEKTTRNGHN